MTKAEKRLDAIRNSPKNVAFDELCAAAVRAGFRLERMNGSHHIFRHPDHPEEMLNLQPKNGMAKPFQVKQFLDAVDRIYPELEP